EAALVEALESGRLAGAAIDVFSKEPYSGPLLEAPNLVVTPHLAASTDEAQDRAGLIVAEQVAAALEGGLVTNAVNIPSVGAEDLEALGPFLPLPARRGGGPRGPRPPPPPRRGPRAVRPRARPRRAGPDHARVLRRAGRARHAPPHARRLERCVPGPRRPAGQLRQRASGGGRARDRGCRAAPPLVARLHEPDRGVGRRPSRRRDYH